MMDESLANFMFHSSKLPYYYIMLVFLLLALVICYFVANSKMGYYFRAIKKAMMSQKFWGQCCPVPSHRDYGQCFFKCHGRNILCPVYSLY